VENQTPPKIKRMLNSAKSNFLVKMDAPKLTQSKQFSSE
jgi:hypothetical protein